MKTREQDDFRSILNILNSTLRWNAKVKSDPSANHKLKWTLRFVWEIAVPAKLFFDETVFDRDVGRPELLGSLFLWQ